MLINQSKANSIANSSQQEGQFAVPRFSVFFTTFRPEHLFTLTRTQFTAAADSTWLLKQKKNVVD
jgi:hypothetical protein